ncbi:MAG: recombinase family protein, partial [Terriglobales bacterium]
LLRLGQPHLNFPAVSHASQLRPDIFPAQVSICITIYVVIVLVKQTLSRMLRNEIYAGWVVSTKNGVKVKGLHEPIISQELFDAVQDSLDGKEATHVIRKKLNDDFPLKGFVRCTGCDKKLTAGWPKGRKEKYPKYWCWNSECPARVSVSRDEIEQDFIGLLGMMKPTQEFLNELPRIAKTYWSRRLERITGERRRLSTILEDASTLNRKILLQKVKGELSGDDFALAKEIVAKQKGDAEARWQN